MLGYKSSRICSGHKLFHAAESKAEHRKVLMGIALQGGMGRRGGEGTQLTDNYLAPPQMK